jgi:U3 small nucleolar ribonucleoprotein component
VALLQLTGRENPDHLSEGSGMNRSSEELHRAAVARARERIRRERAEAQAQQHSADTTDVPDGDNPGDSAR